jgi:hypothetical protein
MRTTNTIQQPNRHMPDIIIRAGNYLSRVKQGFYTELGEGDRLLTEAVAHLKTFMAAEPTQDASTIAGETPAEEAPEEANDPELPPTEEPAGEEAAPGEIPAASEPTPEAEQVEETPATPETPEETAPTEPAPEA